MNTLNTKGISGQNPPKPDPNYTNKNAVQIPITSVAKKNSRLNSLVLKDGNLKLSTKADQLPEFLVKANTAVQNGQIDQVNTLLNEKNIELVHKITDKDSSRTDVVFVLAMLFKQTNKLSEAEKWFEKILEYEQNAFVHNELAYIYQCRGLITKAKLHSEKAVELSPDQPELLANLGRTLIKVGQTRQGINLFRNAVEAEPNNKQLHSNFLFYLHFLPNLDTQILFEEHKRWGQRHAPVMLARTSHKNKPDPQRSLRIGYLSPDFDMHPVTYFFESLLDGHDHRVVELYGYGNVRVPSSITNRLEKKFDFYRNIRSTDDETTANIIEADGIDILVDLAGHTTDNRLGVFAYKPAPIQVTYLGYLDTTGIEQIDYLLTDSFANPSPSQQFYTETLFYLPEGFYCYRPPEFAPPVAPPAFEQNGHITFGAFGNNCKFNPFIVGLWAQILRKSSNSHITLKFGGGNDPELAEFYFRHFEKFGIERNRIQISGWDTYGLYLKQYNSIDITLDTFPKNGGTTTCESLWMGIPIISLFGDHQVSRTGLSILSQLDLEIFAARTPEDYVNKAVTLAENRQALVKLRASMRQRINKTTLGNSKSFACQVEAAYRRMWHRWCQTRGMNV